MSESLTAPALIGVAEPLIMAIDNGGINTRVNLRQGEKNWGEVRFETPLDYRSGLELISAAKRVLVGRKATVNAVGFAIAGQVNDGTITDGGRLKERKWTGQPLKQLLAEKMDIDPTLITMLNDCGAAAKSQSAVNHKRGNLDSGYIERINTGLGGARFILSKESAAADVFDDDELGHHMLREGVLCPCGKNGCAEAYISGSGIERQFGISSEYLTKAQKLIVIEDTVDTNVQMLERFHEESFEPKTLYFYGNVLSKSGWLIRGLRAGLKEKDNRKELPFLPNIKKATFGDNSSLVGAQYAAGELLASAA